MNEDCEWEAATWESPLEFVLCILAIFGHLESLTLVVQEYTHWS